MNQIGQLRCASWIDKLVMAFSSILAAIPAVTRLNQSPFYSTMNPMKTPTNCIDLTEACNRFEKIVERELQRGILTGVSVAWIDDQRIVYQNGFGLADPKRKIPTQPDTVYRAGSISKLFTAVAAMQLAEQGKLDIDRPVTDYAPQFRVVNPFDDAPPITPRLLMGHRAGMVRESPVGGYFDPNEPSLDATIASTADCVLRIGPAR